VTVDLSGSFSQDSFQPCIQVNAQLPPGYYFGATAATGGLSDNHDLFTFVTYSIGDEYYADEEAKRSQPPPQEEKVLQQAAQTQQCVNCTRVTFELIN
jgi:hypothetical protein